MKMKNPTRLFCGAVAAVLLALVAGCATTTKQTEQMLGAAGFHKIQATTPQQLQHLQTLPANKITVAKIKGRTFYVYPDREHKLIFIGNAEEYQTYKEILSDSQLEGQNREMASLGEDTGMDDDEWVAWTSSSGWTYGDN